MKILVIGPSWIGDTVMSQILYRILKDRDHQVIIDVVSSKYCSPLLFRMKEVNKIIQTNFSHGELGINKRYRLGTELRQNHYDHAYVLPNSFKSALIPFFAKIPNRTGWRGEMRYGLINDMRILDKKVWPLMVERYAALAYDKDTIYPSKKLFHLGLWPQLRVFNDEKIQAFKSFNLSLERPIIGFCPDAEFGPAKCWPHYHYATLAKMLIKDQYQILIFGSIKNDRIGSEIFSSLNEEQNVWCRNLMGKTNLDQAIILLSICKVIITNDSGLMHVAAALNCSIIALYGPSSPNFTPPLSEHIKIIRSTTGFDRIRKGSAERGYHHSLVNISPEHVINVFNDLLLNKSKK